MALVTLDQVLNGVAMRAAFMKGWESYGTVWYGPYGRLGQAWRARDRHGAERLWRATAGPGAANSGESLERYSKFGWGMEMYGSFWRVKDRYGSGRKAGMEWIVIKGKGQALRSMEWRTQQRQVNHS